MCSCGRRDRHRRTLLGGNAMDCGVMAVDEATGAHFLAKPFVGATCCGLVVGCEGKLAIAC